MNSVVVMYIGLIVALFILGWGVFEMTRRAVHQGRRRTRALNTWVPFNPASAEPDDHSSPPSNEGKNTEQRAKAQQNGHYTESKPRL